MARSAADVSAGDRWEVGSEYEWMPAEEGPFEELPADIRLYALAQHGLIALNRHTLAAHPDQVLWVPDYFCPPVVDAWRRAGLRMQAYEDDPRWAEPRWASIQASSGDMVLAVNYFGLRHGGPWQAWAARHRDIRIVEDHSHDPWSDWARTSSADYAFASLRKTIPIAEGAMVWSPNGSPLPAATDHRFDGSAFKLAAMIWKRDYLAGAAIAKDLYRDFQARGEAMLLGGADLAMAPWSRSMLEAGIPRRWRERRNRNVRAFYARAANDARFTAIADSPDPDVCPFNAVVIFADPDEREAVRAHLAFNHVYAAVHWRQPSSATDRVRGLGSRILTIPLDQRYTDRDVERIAQILESDRRS